MAGRGPAPKDPNRRARRNKDPIALRVIVAPPVEQPELPTFMVESDGELSEFVWPAVTQEWWRMWGDSPLSTEFTASDWSFLVDTARVHAAFWLGNQSAAVELRLRVAKFGATPEDRARLRITFAQADDADDRRSATVRSSSARDRRGPLTALPEHDADAV